MKVLELSENDLGDESAQYLKSSLRKIEVLKLDRCNLSGAGVEELSAGLEDCSVSGGNRCVYFA